MTNDPLFTKTEAALTFAFHHSAQVYNRPTMNRIAAPALGSGLWLTALDAAGQAGIIRRQVYELGKVAEAILLARFAPPALPCSCKSSCCSGHRRNKEWTDAIAFLADMIRRGALAGCVANGGMRLDYLATYFSGNGKVDFSAMAVKYSSHEQTVRAHYRRVHDYFAGSKAKKGDELRPPPGMEQLARNAIDEKLWELGICGKKI